MKHVADDGYSRSRAIVGTPNRWAFGFWVGTGALLSHAQTPNSWRSRLHFVPEERWAGRRIILPVIFLLLIEAI